MIIKRYLKSIYRSLLPEKLRVLLDIYPSLRECNALTDALSGKKIVVLAPHPDDEIIGCGGTLHKYHLEGADVTAVFMTDGRKGSGKYGEDETAAIRKKEAVGAAAVIGIDRLVFMDNKDSKLDEDGSAAKGLRDILFKVKPDTVFLPFVIDAHPDHAATNMLFAEACRNLPPVMCYAYCVWTPLSFFNIVVDITPYSAVKQKALQQYRSQLDEYDYADASLGLAKYYSLHEKGRKGAGWAEAFIACRSDEYIRLIKTCRP